MSPGSRVLEYASLDWRALRPEEVEAFSDWLRDAEPLDLYLLIRQDRTRRRDADTQRLRRDQD